MLISIWLRLRNRYLYSYFILFIFFPFFAGTIGTPFEENGNAFERNTSYEKLGLSSNDFIQVISTVVNDTYAQNDDTVSFDDLHDLRSSLNHYYLARVFQYFAEKHKMVDEKYHPDPCCLPNFRTVEYPNFYLHQVKVFGFPPLRYAKQVESDIRFDPHSRIYDIVANVSSDVVVVTGKFNVSQDEFLFVYQTFENTYNYVRSNKLASDGLFKLESIIESFSFQDDQLTHTLDSSSDLYTEVNYILYPTFKKVFQQTYLPLLAEWTRSFLKPMIRRRMSNNASLYIQKTVDQLMQHVIGYLHRRNSTQIDLPALIYSNDRTRVYEPLRFENINLEGLLNFAKYNVVHSTNPSSNNSLIVSLQDEIAIDYPVKGDKSAFFHFTFRSGKRRSTKKFKISKISIKMKSEMLLNQYPPRVKPLNVDGYQFLIDFELVDFDETYILLLDYLNNRISKVVTNALGKNEFL